jgi:hypothetical protein
MICTAFPCILPELPKMAAKNSEASDK